MLSFVSMCLLSATVALATQVPVAHEGLFDMPAWREVRIGGFVGRRVDANTRGIVLHRDEQGMLDGFRHRTVGGHPWIGEHVGKWLDTAAMAYAYSGDQELEAKMKRVADELMKTQLPDGYLGTYGEPERMDRWDVWVHKYNLLGLQAYYDVTGDTRALESCRKMADLIMTHIGPGKKDILVAGTHDGVITHQGMAATSILEPILDLFRHTGDKRYLDYGRYIADSLEREGGPHIVSSLFKERAVNKVANAKAYEMISNILGLLSLYRLEGKSEYLQAAEIAFDDIVKRRAYITGGTTTGEAFWPEGHLPNSGHVAEMCVMMSQFQLARELLLLTGDTKYGDAMEHLVLNHILAGQNPGGESVCYYTPLWGNKFYMTSLDCCISSGARVVAMLPSMYYLRGFDRVMVNMLGESRLETTLPNGETPRVEQKTEYPFNGKVSIRAEAPKGIGYTLAVRIPPAAGSPMIKIDGRPFGSTLGSGWSLCLPIAAAGTTIEMDLDLHWDLIKGNGMNEGLFALRYGPVIFAYDHALNKHILHSAAYGYDMNLERLSPKLEQKDGHWIATITGFPPGSDEPKRIALRPFADAGEKGYFSVWLRDRTWRPGIVFSLFTGDHEFLSRPGKTKGSFADNDPTTFSTTDDGRKLDEDWFETHVGWFSRFNVIIFRHGKTFPNGGWFDTSKGKPRVLLRMQTGESIEVGTLEDYPVTTAESPGTLTDGQAFRLIIPKDKMKDAFGVRIIGTPAGGNDPNQNFASCAELQVLYDPDWD